MKKIKLLVLGTSLVLSTFEVSEAAIAVDWSGTDFSYQIRKSDGVTLLPANSLLLAFWSPDVSVGFDPANPTSPAGGDILLQALDSGPAPGYIVTPVIIYNESSYGLPPATLHLGRLYVGIFDFPYSSYSGPGSIPVGTHYTLAPGNPCSPQGGLTYYDPGGGGPPSTPDYINYQGLTYVTSMQIIPEPGVGILAMAGSLVALFVRRRQLARGQV